MAVNIPNGFPLIYELDETLKPVRHYYLGNQADIDLATHASAGVKTAG